MTPITAFGGNREGKTTAVSADALWSGFKGEWSASTDSCLRFGYEWWWSVSVRTCDLLLLKCLDVNKSVHSEHCSYQTALSGFSAHFCSLWASHALHQWFFSGKWSKKVTNVGLCLIFTTFCYEMQYEDHESNTCVATHAVNHSSCAVHWHLILKRKEQVRRYCHTAVSRSLGFIMRSNCWGGCSTCTSLVISSAKYRDRWVQLEPGYCSYLLFCCSHSSLVWNS